MWVKFALVHMGKLADWWQLHTCTVPAHLHTDWDYFQEVILDFCLTGDKATVARGKLLKLSQGSMSVPSYNSAFMRLVRDSHTGPAEPWLTTLYLNGLTDRSLRRSVALENGQQWSDVTQLIKHVSQITAFEGSFSPTTRSPPAPTGPGKWQQQKVRSKKFGQPRPQQPPAAAGQQRQHNAGAPGPNRNQRQYLNAAQGGGQQGNRGKAGNKRTNRERAAERAEHAAQLAERSRHI